MCARSHTSGLMIGSIWRSSWRRTGGRRARACGADRVHGVEDLAQGLGQSGSGHSARAGRRTRGLRQVHHPNVVEVGIAPLGRVVRMAARQWRTDALASDGSSDLSHANESRNTFAARAGRWSAHHRKTAIFGWLGLRRRLRRRRRRRDEEAPPGHSGPGRFRPRRPARARTTSRSPPRSILVQAPRGGTARDANVRRAVDDAVAAVSGKPRVAEVESPFAQGNADQISKDGRSVLVTSRSAATTTRRRRRSTPSWPPSTA